MATPYRELFDTPGTRALALAGLIARVPLPMTGIGIITLLSAVKGSYALAGAVSAVFVFTYAVVSPQVSRLVDRHGQGRVLPLATAISIAGLLLLAVSTFAQAPDWMLFAGALLAGCMPSVSAMVRARWTALHRGRPQLQTAFALETVFDELSFIAGPPIAVALSIGLLPQAGVLAAAVLLAVGVAALVVQRGTEPAVENNALARGRQRSMITLPGVRWLVLLMLAMGLIVGTIDITSVAFTASLGQPAAASLVLSAYALGSCAAGLLFGARVFPFPLHRLLLWSGIATALTTLPLLYVAAVGPLALAVLVAGLFFAPTMIVAMSLIERQVPAHRVTEGMTWLLAGLNVGVAAGAASSGQAVDRMGPSAGFVVALCAGGLVLISALMASRTLARLDRVEPIARTVTDAG
ncbi:MFS transporter [Stenotrophomonas sp. CFBP 13718]|uniref:MFS transporter n=1 Tax=Stenotrophomonas sp. CFBP 13718 TaxID=2775304 RepID=UPI0017852E8C|nr:MFS transporter [Stenotrophomonas sp. CFBP 13718]MBD8697037.1 MFS transporter [Stenotrophomonas sp. CFBP 13718]